MWILAGIFLIYLDKSAEKAERNLYQKLQKSL